MILKDRKSGQSITLFWAKYHHHTICIEFLGNLYISQECCKRVKEFYTKFDFFLKKKKDTIDQMIATNNGETVYVAYNWI